MLIRNLTTNKKWNEPFGEGKKRNGTYDVYWVLKVYAKIGDILLVDGWFYYASPSLVNKSSTGNCWMNWTRCERINALEACEKLEIQREQLKGELENV